MINFRPICFVYKWARTQSKCPDIFRQHLITSSKPFHPLSAFLLAPRIQYLLTTCLFVNFTCSVLRYLLTNINIVPVQWQCGNLQNNGHQSVFDRQQTQQFPFSTLILLLDCTINCPSQLFQLYSVKICIFTTFYNWYECKEQPCRLCCETCTFWKHQIFPI